MREICCDEESDGVEEVEVNMPERRKSESRLKSFVSGSAWGKQVT
jgi:hypothetical protein